jgi:hypothetical protein
MKSSMIAFPAAGLTTPALASLVAAADMRITSKILRSHLLEERNAT